MPCEDSFERTINQTMRLVARLLAARRLQLEVQGLPHIPKHGPVLLVARHYHHLFDGVALLLSIPRPIHVLVTLDWAKSSYWYVHPLMKLATVFAHWPVVSRSDALLACGYPSRRQTAAFTWGEINRHQRRAICDSVELLTQGRLLVVFPEGYPNIDPHYTPKKRPEEWLPFKSGFAAIAAAAERRLETTIPIIPIGFRYTRANRWKCRLNIGGAVYLKDFASRPLLVSSLERRVAELSGLPTPS
jgi:1-acyl-sn-glycerol-3-phosphate acyltransferase